jgi:hypothetical protein
MEKENKLIKLLNLLLFIVPVILVVLHGFQSYANFLIDNTTVLLLLIMTFPLLSKYFNSIKFGGVEASFRKLSDSEKDVFLINEIAKEEKWTYFNPRGDESHSGIALLRMFEKLKRDYPSKFKQLLTNQLESKNNNLIWFASENIGYFKLIKLKNDLLPHIKNLDFSDEVPPHQLNCLWAFSRFNNYKEIIDIFGNNSIRSNNNWAAEALLQMIEIHSTELLKGKNIGDKELAKREIKQIQIINEQLNIIKDKGYVSERIVTDINQLQNTYKETFKILTE